MSDPRLTNADLAPVVPEQRRWRTYDLFALWMSDVHSVGGYVFAAGLFATGLAGWQVLGGMLAGILLVYLFIHLIGLPSQRLGVPYPVIARIAFGVFGANLPALARAAVAIVWYGVQTHFAALMLKALLLRFWPGLDAWAVDAAGFAGLSWLGWACYITMWTLQLLVFNRGMEAIRRYTDFAGPAVYVVMLSLALWMVAQLGVGEINLSLGVGTLTGAAAWLQIATVAALVVSYFAALLLNFGDFSRYCPSERQMVRGNLLGLPLNWMLFAAVTAVITAGTTKLFGQTLMDPVEIVARLDNVAAVVLGSLTLIVATIGINLVANFVSPAFDLANLAPRHLGFRTGGLLAAAITLFTLPWHFVGSAEAMTVFVGTIGGFLGPAFGIIICDYYLVRRAQVSVAELYTASAAGAYWYVGGWNPRAVAALVPAVLLSAAISFLPALAWLNAFNWFVSAACAAVLYGALQRRSLSSHVAA